MALSLHVAVLLLAAVVLDLAMTPVAFQFLHHWPKLIGGVKDVDVNSKQVQEAVDFALQEYNNENDDLNVSSLVRVVRAREQVVAGKNYYLDLEIGRTTCAKSTSEQADCSFSEDPTQLCSFVVYSRPWENYLDLISSSCRSA